MPIYAYKCESCGFAKDVLQKMSDAQLTECPSCEASAFKKQLTAAGFQLKGSGWYATDFKDGGKKPASATSSEGNGGSGGESKSDGKSESSAEAKSESKSDGKGESKGEGKSDSKSDVKSVAKSESKSESKKSDTPVVKKTDSAPAA